LESAKHPVFNAGLVQDSIICELHICGINIQYIGMIVLKLEEKNPYMRNFLVSLMLARALKNMWRNLIHAKKGTRIYEENNICP